MKLVKYFILLFISFTIISCANFNALSKAKNSEQRAYALYGSFVVFEELGASLITSSNVPLSIKRDIKKADAKTKPAADKLLAAVLQVQNVRAELAKGENTEQTLAIVNANLEKWLNDSEPLITEFIQLIADNQ
jgi:hypothetical protein